MRKQNHIEPFCNIFYSFTCIFLYFLLIFLEGKKQKELTSNRVFDNLIYILSPKIHLGKNFLKNWVYNVSENKGVVYVTMYAFVLIGQIGLSRTRKRFYDLGRWDQDVWFNDDHTCLTFFGLFAYIVVIVIHS